MKPEVLRKFAVVVLMSAFAVAGGCGVNTNYANDAGPGAICAQAKDCDSLAHSECDGQWLCTDNACVWNCLPTQGCLKDADCQVWAQTLDVACAGHAACLGGGCSWVCDEVKECYSDTDCPEGDTCELPDRPVLTNGGAEGDVATKCAAAGLKCAIVETGKCVKR